MNSNSSDLELDCTSSCKLVEHGDLITKSLTKRSISEDKLISFLIVTCKNYSRILDSYGRSALHVSSSNSKYKVAEWLYNHGANLIQKDCESGFSAFHRAIYFGCIDIAVLLKRCGASFDAFDSDYYTPLQLLPSIGGAELSYQVNVWGKNKNYNLGIGNVTARLQPDSIEYFRKHQISIVNASINSYHSLFLSADGTLYGCGHSKEGRLGVGSCEATLVDPQEIRIKFPHKSERIKAVAAGLYHSLVLTNKSIYGTGSNRHFQLGMKNVENVLSFKEINFDKTDINMSLVNILACDYHSLFVCSNGVYACGLNVGQFGGIQESIPAVRKLANPISLPNLQIEWASSNNACICIYLKDTKARYLSIYYSRKVKTYKNPLMENIIQCAINGGEMLYNSDEISKQCSQKPLTITFLTENKNLYIWYEDIQQFVKIHISTSFTAQIQTIKPCRGDLLLLVNGHLFNGLLQHKVSKMYNLQSDYQEFHTKKEIAQFLCSKLNVKRIANVSDVESYFFDPHGTSFVAILKHVNVAVPELAKDPFDFSELLDDGMLMDSKIYDIKINVERESFRANRFIIYSRSKYLKNLLETEAKDGEMTINDNRLTNGMFRVILKYLYTNDITDDDAKLILKPNDKNAATSIENFHSLLIDWDLNGIISCISKMKQFKKFLPKQEPIRMSHFKWFKLENYPELYDVVIVLDENQKLRAHKVVLMMRLEYFKMMFHHSWSEESVVDLKHLSINYLRPIIQFAYDNDMSALMNTNFSENFLYNMIAICDQYLIENVKNIFESMISSRVTIRNCADNLEFSFTYNCNSLRDYCMRFICCNLSRVLEGNVLDNLDVEMLQELSKFYKKFFNYETDSNRIILPAFDAPTEEEIDEAIKDFNLATYVDSNNNHNIKKTPKVRNRLSKSELLKRNYEKEAIKNIQIDELPIDQTIIKSPEVVSNMTWHRTERERKDSTKKKSVLAAMKCNEIMKSEVAAEPEILPLMVDLRSLSISEDYPRSSSFTLADFCVKSKKTSSSPPIDAVTPTKTEPKPAWNMESIELKPINLDLDPFSATPSKKTQTPKQKASSAEKNFSAILKDERKDKENFVKTKSKSLALTQIEEQAIIELSAFYNIDNIFDENIKIQRKVHRASQNFSQWQCQIQKE